MKTQFEQQGSEAFDALLNDDLLMNRLAHQAVQDALREHKRRGESVVVWQNGQVVRLSPEEIPLDETD